VVTVEPGKTRASGVDVFLLPDVGEGLTEAEVVTWHVAEGDEVGLNDVLVEIETAKSLVELPSPYAGVVHELLAAEGQTIPVGAPLVSVRTGQADVEIEAPLEPEATEAPLEPPATTAPETSQPTVLVGYGPSKARATRRHRRAATQEPSGDSVAAPTPVEGDMLTRAKPPVRKLAKHLGVDLTEVTPTGANGTVTRTDVEGHARAAVSTSTSTTSQDPAAEDDVRIPVKGVRRAIAKAMTHSAFTAPHVTEFLTVDVTRSLRLVEKLRAEKSFADGQVTLLLLAAKAVLAALREFPDVNASWDDATEEIVLHQAVNLGIAAATPRGLLVPNVKGADRLSLTGLSLALADLVRTARDGATSPEVMARGTFTITNVGVFGVDTATPIINPGEAAILCLGTARFMPWGHRGRVELRSTMQLALSFDHRLIDGELGSRFLARVGEVLENPRWELLLV